MVLMGRVPNAEDPAFAIQADNLIWLARHTAKAAVGRFLQDTWAAGIVSVISV
jgi:hypothetical protein